MAERRYGFRFSFAEGCIIVVSIVGFSFLVFLFGIYAGRELEARKAAEHTSSVRLTVTGEGAAAAPSVNSFSTGPQEKAATPKPTFPQNLQNVPGEYQSTKASINPSPPSASPVADSEKKLTSLPATESIAAMEPLKKVQTNAATLKASPTPSAALHGAIAEEKKQIEKEESYPSLTRKPSPAQGRWSVQVQALRDEEGARQLVRRLQSQGYAPMISRVVRDGEVWYRVRVGSFASSEEARTSVERLRREGKFPQAYPTSN